MEPNALEDFFMNPDDLERMTWREFQLEPNTLEDFSMNPNDLERISTHSDPTGILSKLSGFMKKSSNAFGSVCGNLNKCNKEIFSNSSYN